MKKFIYTFIFLGLAFPMFSQVLDNTINIEVQTEALYSNVPIIADPFDVEEVVLNVNVWTSFGGWEPSNDCFQFTSDGEKYIYNHHQVILDKYSVPYNTTLDFFLSGWESDSSPACSYNGNDTNYEQKTASDYFLLGPFVTYPRPMSIWSTDWSSQNNEWLFYDYDYDISVRTTWRYANGQNTINPLDFGTINTGTSRWHSNANRPGPSGSFDPNTFGYADTGFQSGPDVYYRFVLDQRASVTISTDHGYTDFDTYLTLLNSSGEAITNNDDVVPGSNTKSVIANEPLCAGTYFVVVEGFQDYTGDFELSVLAESLSGVTSGGLTYEYPDCPGGTGTATANPSGGVPPYTFLWPNGGGITDSNTASGIPYGAHFGKVIDACGNEKIFEVFMTSTNDQTPPVAVCTPLSYTLSPGGIIEIDPYEMGSGSTDNCGIDTYILTQNNFSYNDVGINQVILYVTDESGNESSCSGTVEIIQNNPTATRDLMQAIPFSLQPNPASDRVTLVLSNSELSSDAQVSIMTITGQEIWHTNTNNDQMIDLSHFSKGLYLVKVQDGEKAGTKKLVVQ
jgi:type IX secretion system substrate protein/pre-peptidase